MCMPSLHLVLSDLLTAMELSGCLHVTCIFLVKEEFHLELHTLLQRGCRLREPFRIFREVGCSISDLLSLLV